MRYKYTTLGNDEFVFRGLSAEEADRIYQNLHHQNPYLEEYIFNLITDNAYDIDELEAGIIPTIVYLSIKLSGVLKDAIGFPDGIESVRETITKNAYYLLYATIVRAQPTYNLATVKKLTFNELIEEFAFSEMILGKQTVDTKAARKSILDEIKSKSDPTSGKKGMKAFTVEELELLKEAIATEEYGGMPIDGF